jgi:DnaJ-class molecular chaperone
MTFECLAARLPWLGQWVMIVWNGGPVRNEKCSHCGQWKVECDHCNGRGYFGNEPLGLPACDHCDGEGLKCQDAWRSSNCG